MRLFIIIFILTSLRANCVNVDDINRQFAYTQENSLTSLTRLFNSQWDSYRQSAHTQENSLTSLTCPFNSVWSSYVQIKSITLSGSGVLQTLLAIPLFGCANDISITTKSTLTFFRIPNGNPGYYSIVKQWQLNCNGLKDITFYTLQYGTIEFNLEDISAYTDARAFGDSLSKFKAISVKFLILNDSDDHLCYPTSTTKYGDSTIFTSGIYSKKFGYGVYGLLCNSLQSFSNRDATLTLTPDLLKMTVNYRDGETVVYYQ